MIVIQYLKEFNFVSVLLRLLLALLFGSMLGMERARKGRAAGFRTYALVCVGAALTILLSQYLTVLMSTVWAADAEALGIRTEASRFGAQVINGIGFLGAGTIMVTKDKVIQGVTTAAGLWACACVGLAIGAGFFECVIPVFILMDLCFRLLPSVGTWIRDRSRNFWFYVEFDKLENIGTIINKIKSMDVRVIDMELEHGSSKRYKKPSVSLFVRTRKGLSHVALMEELALLDCISQIHEVL